MSSNQNLLQQQLLELVHELLPKDEASAMQARIDTDPAVAKAYQDALAEARLLAQATRLEEPQLDLAPPATPIERPADTHRPRSASRWLTWTVGLAATILLLATAGVYLVDSSASGTVAAKHMRLRVMSSSQRFPGVDLPITIRTESVDGQPIPARLKVALYDDQQKQLLDEETRIVNVGASGIAQFMVPAHLKLSGPTRLEVLAFHGDAHHRATAPLIARDDRCLTQLALDKPWYQPGETVRFRSLTVSSYSLAAKDDVPIEFEILDPSGAAVANSKLQGITHHGVGNGEFKLEQNLPGGQYTLVARSLNDSMAETKKVFLLRRYRLPRLKKELELVRDSYTPGDIVVADLQARRAEGEPAAAARVQITATVDGEVVFEKTDQLDAAGLYQVTFTLPDAIDVGDALLAVIVDDGGTRETVAKTIPINLGKVEVDFYPEGGDLVAGIQNRIYFDARDPKGDPVHIEGHIVDSSGKKIAEIATQHEGRGRFTLVPDADETYRLKINKPAGVFGATQLPKMKSDATLVIATGDGVFAAGQPIRLWIRSTEPNVPLAVTARCRGLQVGQALTTTGDFLTAIRSEVTGVDTHSVTVPLADSAEGVIRITVYDYSTGTPRPITERLVYRQPARKLNVKLADHSEAYSPGQPVSLSMIVTDENDQPASGATLGISIVDDTLLALARESTREKPIDMPTHFLLGTEIESPEDLEDANFYLSEGTEAAAALDLLLGTQGWRRFVDPTNDSMLAGHAPATNASVQTGKDETLRKARIEKLLVSHGTDAPPVIYDNLASADQAYRIELAEVESVRESRLATIGRIATFAGGALLLAIGIVGLLRLASRPRLWIPTMAAATGCLILAGFWLAQRPGTSSWPSASLSGDVAYAPELAKNGQRVASMRDHDDYRIDPQAIPVEELARDEIVDLAEKPVDMMPGNALEGQNGNVQPGADAPEEKLVLEVVQKQLARVVKPLRRIREQKEFHDLAALLPLGDFKDADGQGKAMFGPKYNRFGNFAEKAQAFGKLREQGGQGGGRGKFDYERLEKALTGERSRLQFPVRQYAHQHVSGQPGVRSDFTETLFWNPLVIADEEGRATLRFELSDAVTSFRVRADLHSTDADSNIGRLGVGDASIVSRIPFSLAPKLPLEVNAGDVIRLPLAVVNDTANSLGVDLSIDVPDLFQLEGDPRRTIELAAGQRHRETFPLTVVGARGEAVLTFRGTAGSLGDAVRKTVSVVPPGFPMTESFAGKITADENITLELPKDWVRGSLALSVAVYPTTLADLQQGIDAILREPYGCFEQASTSNYPNVLVLQYLKEHQTANPAATRRAKELLKRGYGKLTGYECKKKGYEWFGGDPGHEALTAYGLLQFRDMAEVYDVDAVMIQRTAVWLLGRRDGNGGFKRNPRALDSFGGAPNDVTNAYITWALTESGQEGLDEELEHTVALGRKSDDPYVIALAAASAINGGQKKSGRELLDKLKGAQQADGKLLGTQGSITRSGGHSLAVETTALAAMAFMKDAAYTTQATKAVDWIVASRQGSGGFGSTQATILALKALVGFARANRGTVTGGDLIVLRNEQEIGRVSFKAGAQEAIGLDNLAEKLKPGKNQLTLRLTGDNTMPYSVELAYRTSKPVSDTDCPIGLTTTLAKKTIGAGKTVAMLARVTNTTDVGQPMTVAILGIPAGLKARPDQLEELKKAGTIDYYETRAREVICYWRSLAPGREIDVKLDLVAEVPGTYTAPASRAYLYYTAENKQWCEPVAIDIK